MKKLKLTSPQRPINTLFNKSKLLLCICFASFALLFSCSEDDITDALGLGCDANDWSEAYTDYINDFSEAAEDYATNPTAENCRAYKRSVENYIDAIDDLEDCYDGSGLGDDFDDYIDELKSEVDGLCDD